MFKSLFKKLTCICLTVVFAMNFFNVFASVQLQGKEIKIFAGSANKELAKNLAENLGLKISDSNVLQFSDGEIKVGIHESVMGAKCFVVQSVCKPSNDNLMELLITIDALKREFAGEIIAVIPYLGYLRQDRQNESGEAITAKLMAQLIEAAGANRVLSVDLHYEPLLNFFNIPIENISSVPRMCECIENIEKFDPDNFVILSPYFDAIKNSHKIADKLKCELVIATKRKLGSSINETLEIIGNVKGKTVIIIDDMIDTAGTICNVTSAVMNEGAKEVYVFATHGLLSGLASIRIEKSAIKKVFLSDTLPVTQLGNCSKIEFFSIADVLADEIRSLS